MGRTYAGVLGPVAFLTVLARSFVEGGTAASTLQIATVCLFVFAGLGFAAGQIANMVVLESVRTRFDEEMKAQAASETEQKTV